VYVDCSHREEIESLKQKDPEFFSFLAENDAQALGFGQDDEDDYLEEERVDDNLDLDNNDDEDQEFHADVGTGSVEVTMDMLRQVVHKSISGHYDSVRRLIKMFKAACVPADDVDDEDNEVGSRGGYVIPSSEMYNEVMAQVLSNAHLSFRAVLGLAATADISVDAKSHPKWKKVQLLVLSFFKSILHLLSKFSMSQQDDQIVAFLIDKMENYVVFLFSMPRLSKATLKALLNIWSQDLPSEQTHSNSRGHAFLRIMQMAKTLPGTVLEECFRAMYLTFSRNSKSFTESSSGTVLFMSECIAALFSVDTAMAYQQSFLYIRQLALHLRAALAKKSADAVKLVSSWQYLNCVRLWTKVICTMPAKSQLGELGFPLIQIILGVLVSSPSPYLYPLRFHLITCLHQLAASCQVFVPTASTLLEILENPELFAKPSASTELAPNLRFIVKLPTDSLNRANVRDLVVAEAIALISHDSELYRYNAGFPEYAFVTMKKLRVFSKKCKHAKWRDLSRALGNQLEEFSSVIKKERVRAVMSGTISSNFEQLLPATALPVAQRLSKLLSSRIAHAVSLSASSVKLDAHAGRKRAAVVSKGHDDVSGEESDSEDSQSAGDLPQRPRTTTLATVAGDNKQSAKRKSKATGTLQKSKKLKAQVGGKLSGDTGDLRDTVNALAWSDDENDD
jgi:nucleolar complex protein 2